MHAKGAFLRFGALSLAFHAALGAAVVAFAGYPRLSALHPVVLFDLVDAPRGSGAAAAPAAAVRKSPAREAPAVPSSAPAGVSPAPVAPAASVPESIPAPEAGAIRAVEGPGDASAGAPGPGGTAETGGSVPAGTQAEAAAGAGAGDGSDPSSQARAGYLDLLLGRIDRRKEYPGAARRLGHEGTVVVGFVLGNDGRVGSLAVERSSGSPLLDAAALRAVSGAGRLPPPPPAFRGAETRFVLPVQFRLDPPANPAQ